MIITFVILLLVMIGCSIFDNTLTHKGIEKGVAVEGNTWLDTIFGTDKPTLLDLYLFEIIAIAIICIPAGFGFAFHIPALVYASCGGFVARSVQHIKGGLAWIKLLK
jgi:hypothetical protein